MGKRRKPVRRGRRAWFKPYSMRNQSQPDAYRMGVLYGNKSISLDEQVRRSWMADGDYTTELTILTHDELRIIWANKMRTKLNVLKPYSTLLNGNYDKIKLYSNGSEWVFFRERYRTDGTPMALIRSIRYFSREKAMAAFWAETFPIQWESVVREWKSVADVRIIRLE
jgi:hypothetical protein